MGKAPLAGDVGVSSYEQLSRSPQPPAARSESGRPSAVELCRKWCRAHSGQHPLFIRPPGRPPTKPVGQPFGGYERDGTPFQTVRPVGQPVRGQGTGLARLSKTSWSTGPVRGASVGRGTFQTIQPVGQPVGGRGKRGR